LVAFFFTGFFLAAIGYTPSSIDNKRMSSVLQTDPEKPIPERLPALTKTDEIGPDICQDKAALFPITSVQGGGLNISGRRPNADYGDPGAAVRELDLNFITGAINCIS